MTGALAADTSVVMAAHTFDRWDSICAAIDSVMEQQNPPREIIVSIDHNAELQLALTKQYPGIQVILNDGQRGAGSTRNRGVDEARSTYVAFIDDDAVAKPGWLANLVAPLVDPTVIGVGGFVSPKWSGPAPSWFPLEFYWVIGASYRGMPTHRSPIRNVWSECMAVRRDQFLAVGGFREGYGKIGDVAAPEDTDLCIRMAEANPQTHWLYEPAARIAHEVPRERASIEYLLKRSFNEGRAKYAWSQILKAEGSAEAGLSEEREHAVLNIPKGIVSDISAALVSANPMLLVRAFVCLLAFVAAVVGYASAKVSHAPSVKLKGARVTPGAGHTRTDHQAKTAVRSTGDAARRQLSKTDSPWECLTIEVCERIPRIPVNPGSRKLGGVHAIVRVFGEPVGVLWLSTGHQELSPNEVSAAIDRHFGHIVRQRLAEVDIHIGDDIPVDGITSIKKVPWQREQEVARREGPEISVIICTRNRPDGLRVTLEALARQDYPKLTVIVVDNGPSFPATRQVVESFTNGPIPVDYYQEPNPGLSRARNTGVSHCDTEIVAFVDDDEAPDPDWVTELARGFMTSESVDCVTGIMAPNSLETTVEQLFELWGGHNKGLEFEQLVFDGSRLPRTRIMFPRPAFGAGGNMAFRTDVLRALGDFDIRLGAGTPVRAAEDTDIFARLLLSGRTLIHRPTAIVGHRHRATSKELVTQLYGYGSGLTAWYMVMILRQPALLLTLLRVLPEGVKAVTQHSEDEYETDSIQFPPELRRSSFLGYLAGPVNLVRSAVTVSKTAEAKLYGRE